MSKFKVGDRVRRTIGSELRGHGMAGTTGVVVDVGAAEIDIIDDSTGDRLYGCSVRLGGFELIAPTIKVGDWVRTDDGEIGIVLHDDGTGIRQFKVGFVGDGDHGHWDWYSDLQLTVVPSGTAKASNDNAPILAEIDELEQRLSDLRAKLAA